jgi:hypothetical protein
MLSKDAYRVDPRARRLARREFTATQTKSYIRDAIDIIEATGLTSDSAVARLLAKEHGGDYGDFFGIAITAGGLVQRMKDRRRVQRRVTDTVAAGVVA